MSAEEKNTTLHDKQKKRIKDCIWPFLGLLILNYLLVGLLYLIMGESLTKEIISEVERGAIDIPTVIAILLPTIVGILVFASGDTVKNTIKWDLRAIGFVLSCVATYVFIDEIRREGILAAVLMLVLLGVIATPVYYVFVFIFKDE